MSAEYYKKKTKKGFRKKKRLVKGIKVFLKKKKMESVNMLMCNTEIFLKKRNIKSINMVANNIKIFLKIKNKVWLIMGKIILKSGKIKTG